MKDLAYTYQFYCLSSTETSFTQTAQILNRIKLKMLGYVLIKLGDEQTSQHPTSLIEISLVCHSPKSKLSSSF